MAARKRSAAEAKAAREERLLDMAMTLPLGFRRHEAARRLALDGNAIKRVLDEALAAGMLATIRAGRKVIYTHASRVEEVTAALDDFADMNRRPGLRIRQTIIPASKAIGKIPRLRLRWVFDLALKVRP